MIFTDQEYETLLYFINLVTSRVGLGEWSTANALNLRRKLVVMREMDRAARTEKVMRDMLDALIDMFDVDPAYFPAGLCDPGENLEALLEELGGT